MIPGAPPPEIPPPGVPAHPDPGPESFEPAPSSPLPQVPVHLRPADPVERLRADRRLLMMGVLDHRTADRVCAELMLADGLSAEPIELIVNSPGGPVDAVLGVIDVTNLLRAPLATRCIGVATGTAAVVLASGAGGRSAAPNATISLRMDDKQTIEGRADDIRRDADRITHSWHRIAQHLAGVSSMTVEQAATALRDGGHLSLDDAIVAGIIDEVARR